jgi:hypothetical protein
MANSGVCAVAVETRPQHQRTIRHEDCRYLPWRPHDAAILIRHSLAQTRHGIHGHIMA